MVPLNLIRGGDYSSWYSFGLVIERWLAPGSNPKLVMCRYTLGNDILSLFSVGTKQSSTCCVAQHDNRHANRTQTGCYELAKYDSAECLVLIRITE